MALIGVLTTQLWHDRYFGDARPGFPAEAAEPNVRMDLTKTTTNGRQQMSSENGNVRKEMRVFIEEQFLYMQPDRELADSDQLLGEGIIDSLGFVELVEEVQSRYGVTVADTEITEENFGSVDAIAGFVERKQGAG